MATPVSNGFLNAALVVGGLLVLVLVYSLAARGFAPRVDPVREANPANLVGTTIQVEVRNGCGVSGLAGRMTRFLRERGFDVVEIGDYTSFDVEHTIVIDRTGDMETARKVATAIGLGADRIVQEINLDAYLDASVVIGKDFASIRAFDR
jgi:hypothetical protein